ncbi:MAG: 4-diphosphocytidyl-2C-methyl-D-erythritol kinase [marine bacterium B5-7]|nr:MAG: 4-diphosphocytidyl-2C-methyl-D-erythritol kinase [marine bacterium B5-7]
MDNATKNIYAIILAAGESSRFGSPKQLADWQEHNLLQHAINTTQLLFDKHIIVVLGANAELIQSRLDASKSNIETNNDWRSGISSSIRAGIKALPKDTEAAMILLCDQPLLEESSLKKLIDLWQQHRNFIVASEYQDTVGVPAIFPAAFFSQLEALQGDKGAKQLLISMKEHVLTISVPEASIDIDTQNDFNNLKMQFNI